MLNNPWMLGGNSMGHLSNSVGNPAMDGAGGSGHVVFQTQSVSISSTDGSVIHQTNTYESWVTVTAPPPMGLDMVQGQNMFGSLDMSGVTRGSETYLAVPMSSEGLTPTSALTVGIQSPFVTHNHVEPVVAIPAQMSVSEPSLMTAVQNPSETYIALPVPTACDPLVAVPTVQNIYNPLVSATHAESQVPFVHTTPPIQTQANIHPSWYLVVQDMPEPTRQMNCTAPTTLFSQSFQSEDRLYLCVRCNLAFEKLSCLEWHLKDCRGIFNYLGSSMALSASAMARKIQTIQCSSCKKLYNIVEEIRFQFVCVECGQRSAHFPVLDTGGVRQLLNCSECNEQFECESELDDHISSHKSSVTICELPDNYVEENGNEDGHVSVKIEPPEDNEESESCESGSSDEDCQGKKNRSFHCAECGHNFQNGEDLKSHLKVHGKLNLEKHIWTDSRRDRAKEVVADSCFAEQEEDTKEKLVIKPFGCTECGMRFSDSSELKEHCVTHLRSKPFSCTQCGEKFEATASLEKHWEAHNYGME